MKAKVISLLLIVIIIVQTHTIYAQSNNYDEQIGECINKQDYFGMRKILNEHADKLSDFMLSLSKSLEGNHFNRPLQAIQYIPVLLERYQNLIQPSPIPMVVMLAENYALTGNYKAAVSIYESLIKQLSDQGASTSEYTETINRYKAFSDIPPQKMLLEKTTTIPLKIDYVGLTTIPVTINGRTSDFVFDTGAGFSVLSEEYAKEMGVKILETNTGAIDAIGNIVQMKFGIADKLILGDAVFENVTFLIMPDKIAWKEIPGYEIEGIIGMHLMFAMKEVHVTRGESITIPKEINRYNKSNMLLMNLMPNVQAVSGKDTLILKFDSGSVNDNLNAKYFNNHKDYILKKAQRDTIKSGSAGGMKEGIEVYALKDFPLEIGGKKTIIPRLNVQTSPVNQDSSIADGLIGQSFIRAFDKMIINFVDMYITFE